ncbi:hypothetical protein ZWY2020_047912 [Hordeum vulgare]|nr:hypothetical protein ZWY2020_047912 [Hordeum vulgare]
MSLPLSTPSPPTAAPVGGPLFCVSRSLQRWADWADEAEEVQTLRRTPMARGGWSSLAPWLLGSFLAAAQPARRRAGKAPSRSFSAAKPRRHFPVTCPRPALARPGAPPGLSPLVAAGAGDGPSQPGTAALRGGAAGAGGGSCLPGALAGWAGSRASGPSASRLGRRGSSRAPSRPRKWLVRPVTPRRRWRRSTSDGPRPILALRRATRPARGGDDRVSSPRAPPPSTSLPPCPDSPRPPRARRVLALARRAALCPAPSPPPASPSLASGPSPAAPKVGSLGSAASPRHPPLPPGGLVRAGASSPRPALWSAPPSPVRSYKADLMARLAGDSQPRPKRASPADQQPRPAPSARGHALDTGLGGGSSRSGRGGSDRAGRSPEYYPGTSLRHPLPPRDPERDPRLPLPGSRGDIRRREAAHLSPRDIDREAALRAELVARPPPAPRSCDEHVPRDPRPVPRSPFLGADLAEGLPGSPPGGAAGRPSSSSCCPTTLACLGYDTKRGSFYFVDAEIEEEVVRPHLATVTLPLEQVPPAGLVISADLIRDELAAYIGDFHDSSFAWEVTETAPLVFSVPFPSDELLRVCSHDVIRCPINKLMISVKAATAEPDPVPPLEKVWVLVYGLPREGSAAPWGGKLTHILKAISEPVGKLITADLASFEDDGPPRIEILCSAPAENDGLSLVFYFGSKGRRLTFELESPVPMDPSGVDPDDPAPEDGGLEDKEGSSEEGSSSEGDVDAGGAPPESPGAGRIPATSTAGPTGHTGGTPVVASLPLCAADTRCPLPLAAVSADATEEEGPPPIANPGWLEVSPLTPRARPRESPLPMVAARQSVRISQSRVLQDGRIPTIPELAAHCAVARDLFPGSSPPPASLSGSQLFVLTSEMVPHLAEVALDSGIVFRGEKGPPLEQISASCIKERFKGALTKARVVAARDEPSLSVPAERGHRETRDGGAPSAVGGIVTPKVGPPLHGSPGDVLPPVSTPRSPVEGCEARFPALPPQIR